MFLWWSVLLTVQQPSRTCGWFTPQSSKQTRPWGRGPFALSDGAAAGRPGVPFKWHWRNTAAAGGRGRCRRLWPVLVKRAEAARCPSSCCRKSLRSSDSGAGQRPPHHWVMCSLIKRHWILPMIRGPTFLLEMENSFSHSLHWLASLSFSQTWPPWNNP